jgi:hypothetical protein
MGALRVCVQQQPASRGAVLHRGPHAVGRRRLPSTDSPTQRVPLQPFVVGVCVTRCRTPMGWMTLQRSEQQRRQQKPASCLPAAAFVLWSAAAGGWIHGASPRHRSALPQCSCCLPAVGGGGRWGLCHAAGGDAVLRPELCGGVVAAFLSRCCLTRCLVCMRALCVRGPAAQLGDIASCASMSDRTRGKRILMVRRARVCVCVVACQH